MMDTQTDRLTHRRTRVISIVPPLLQRVTNRKNSYTAFNHLLLFFFFFQNGKGFHDVLIYLHVNQVTDLNENLQPLSDTNVSLFNLFLQKFEKKILIFMKV